MGQPPPQAHPQETPAVGRSGPPTRGAAAILPPRFAPPVTQGLAADFAASRGDQSLVLQTPAAIRESQVRVPTRFPIVTAGVGHPRFTMMSTEDISRLRMACSSVRVRHVRHKKAWLLQS